MKLEKFEGLTEPIITEKWLNFVQTILDFLNFNDQDKVRCNTFLLKKDAKYWWETIKIWRNTAEMSWANFVMGFNHKYYNQVTIRAKQSELINLNQGNMTMMEDVRKFDQLARIWPTLMRIEELHEALVSFQMLC